MSEQRILSDEQVAQFHRDGYLVVRGMYSADEVVDISRWTDEVANMPEVPGKYMMYFEKSRNDGARIICRIENFVPYHEGFSKLITDCRMQQAVSELLGEDAVLFKDKINFKLPGGDGFKEHQDVQAGWDEFADVHITAMIAIDETNEANGSLEMIPGMHTKGVLGEMWAPLTDEDTHHVQYQAVHCQPGDATRRTARSRTVPTGPGACCTSPTTRLRKVIRVRSITRTNAATTRRTSSATRTRTTRSRFEHSSSQETQDGKHIGAGFPR